jgi:DNA polymerase-3 subunit epsilon/CBS domain-containing protein
MTVSNATPLVALDALLLDTETTGLDPAKARLIEIGMVRLRGGRFEQDFRRLVHPGERIPPAVTAVHGIDDAAVANAPAFAELADELGQYFADTVVIGHSLGFDFAVLRNEFGRAGRPWTPPRALDIRLLAELTQPNLPDYSLDQLAVWLDLSPQGRHSALGDAMAAGRVFLALVPKLREVGIRTLAEAERASASLTHVLDAHGRAGWERPVTAPRPPAPEDQPSSDLFPYRNRVRTVMSAPIFAPADLPLQQALGRMMEARISSLLVAAALFDTLRADQAAIFTERDAMRMLAVKGAGALALPIGPLSSRPLMTVSAEAFAHRAIARMGRHKVRHLGVTDEHGGLCGVVTARDLLRLRASDAIWLGDEIDEAPDAAALGRAWAKLPMVARALRREGVPGREVAALVSEELCALTGRAAHLAERALAEAGRGAPPCRYAVAVLGSAGRGESLLALDQDNALVFERDIEGADAWFADFGSRLADLLHEVGVPYCKGGVMAKNPQWRGSVATWTARVAHWIDASDPGALLSVDIFFDLRGVHGDRALANEIWRHAFDQAAGRADFAKLLAEAAGAVEPGFGLFGQLRTSEGRIDVKKTALFGIVTAARVLAIRHHIVARATAERIEQLRAMGVGADADLEALLGAQDTILDLLVDQQAEDIEHGLPPSNRVAVSRLSAGARDRLRAALRAVRHIDELARELLFR